MGMVQVPKFAFLDSQLVWKVDNNLLQLGKAPP